MRKRVSAIFLACAVLATSLPTYAFATEPSGEGRAGQIIEGEYVAVVNTASEPSVIQNTGTLIYDADAGFGEESVASISEELGLVPSEDIISESPAKANHASRKSGKRSVPGYTIGQEETFYQGKTFRCIKEGTESYVWMEKKLYEEYVKKGTADTAGQEVADLYDGRPSKVIKELGGDDASLYTDNTGKLSILIEEMAGSSGFYAGEEGITAIHINGIPADQYRKGSYTKYDGLLVHEMQHAMFRHLACNGDKSLAYEVSWINEGLSVAAMDYYWGGEDPTGWLGMIDGNLKIRQGSSLMYSAYRNNAAQDYSMPYLFIRYLINQKEKGYNPAPMIQAFYNGGMNAKGGAVSYINSVLKAAGLKNGTSDLTYAEAIGNFYAAAMAQHPEKEYGFWGDPIVAKKITDYPVYAGESGKSIELKGSAGIIIKTIDGSFTIPDDAGHDIRFIAFDKAADVGMPEGSGTAEDPYQLVKAADLSAMSKANTATFKLMNDLTVASEEVLFPAKEFKGVLDGNKKTISGLAKPLVYNNSGVIKNLTVNGFEGEFRSWTGVISNFNSGTIADCSVTGTVNVRFTGTKAFEYPCFGTMTAQNEMSGIIRNCFSDAAITIDMPSNNDFAGMIAGYNKFSIVDCYSRGSLTINGKADAKLSVGGIVGEQYSSIYPKPSMQNCYSTTAILINGGTDNVIGQIAGYVQDISSLSGCYALEGKEAVYSGKKDGATSKSEAELQKQETYQGWAFGSVWQMSVDDGMPEFYQPSSGSLVATMGKKEYYIGEKLEFYGSVLSVGGKNIPMTSDMIVAFDSSTAGEKPVKGTYKGVEFSTMVTVKEPQTVEFLEVYEKPRTEYVEGEIFDPTGTRLRATIDGSPNHYLTAGYTVDKTQPLQVQDNQIVYSYRGKLTTSLPIHVKTKESAVSQITVMGTPRMTGYYIGDKLDVTGLKVQLVYQDGRKSEVIEPAQFGERNISLSKRMNTKIAHDAVLADEDNRAMVHIYYGDKLPETGGSIYAEIGELEVKRNLWLGSQTLKFTVGKDNYVQTDAVEGVTTGVTCSSITDQLPTWITTHQLPSPSNSYVFKFEGKPTQEETVDISGTLTDQASGKSIPFKLTLQAVPPSAECSIERFTVTKQIGLGIPVYAGIINEENQTIAVTVPPNYPRTLQYSINASTGATGGGGNTSDFSQPRQFTITAENQIDKKTYTTTLYEAVEGKTLAKPEDPVWTEGIASWNRVEGATAYVVELLERTDVNQPANDYPIAVKQTTDISIDLSPYIAQRKHYVFRVTALDETNQNLQAVSDKSPMYKYEGAVIRSVFVEAGQSVAKVGTEVAFSSRIEGLGEYDRNANWYVSGAFDPDTRIVGAISDSGEQTAVLHIGKNETAEDLIIRAASVQDANIYAEAVVAIEQQTPLPGPVSLAWDGEVAKWTGQDPEHTEGYRVVLMKDGQEVRAAQDIASTSVDFGGDIATNGAGSYTFLVEAYGVGFLDSNRVESPAYVCEAKEVTAIALNKENAYLNKGDTLLLTAKTQPENAKDREVTWSSSNDSVAAVDANGLVIAKAEGTTVITASTANGITATCQVSVSTDSKKYLDVIYVSDSSSGSENGTGTKEDPMRFRMALTRIKDGGTLKVRDVMFHGYATELGLGNSYDELPHKDLIIEGTEANSDLTYKFSLVFNGDVTLRNIQLHALSHDTDRNIYLKGHDMTVDNVTVNTSIKTQIPSVVGGSQKPEETTLEEKQNITLYSGTFNAVYAGGKGTTKGNVHMVLGKGVTQNKEDVPDAKGVYAGGLAGGTVDGEVLIETRGVASNFELIDGAGTSRTTLQASQGSDIDSGWTKIQNIEEVSVTGESVLKQGEITGLERLHVDSDSRWVLLGSQKIKDTLSGGGKIQFINPGHRIQVDGQIQDTFTLMFKGEWSSYFPESKEYIRAAKGGTGDVVYTHPSVFPFDKKAVLQKQKDGEAIAWSIAEEKIIWTSMELQTVNMDQDNTVELIGGRNRSGKAYEVRVISYNQDGKVMFNPAAVPTKDSYESIPKYKDVFSGVSGASGYLIGKYKDDDEDDDNRERRIPAGDMAMTVSRTTPEKVELAKSVTIRFKDAPELSLKAPAGTILPGVATKLEVTLEGAQGYTGTLKLYDKSNQLLATKAITEAKTAEIPMTFADAGEKELKVTYTPTNSDHYREITSQSIALSVESEQKPITAVSLNKTSVSLQKGASETLQATIAPADTTSSKSLTWTSSSPGVASVDSAGRITAKAKGTTTITVRTSNGKTASCKVTVTLPPKPITAVSLNKTSVSLRKGVSETLRATIAPADTTSSKTLTWTSSAPGVASVDSAGKITAKAKGTTTITVRTSNGKTASCKVTVTLPPTPPPAPKPVPNIQYKTHVQKVGWQGWVQNGTMSGTSGRALRLEGINIQLLNNAYGGGVEYRTHVQSVGWMDWARNGKMSGTSGRALRLEGIDIRLYGEIAEAYDIYYRVHAQTLGWLDWAKNGQSAGSAGYAYRLEGIQIKLVKKGGTPPGDTATPFVQKYVEYRTHVQKDGWQGWSFDGRAAGTTGRALRLEGIQVRLSNQKYSGGIQYRTHVQKIGWENRWSSNGGMSGTNGRALRLEAIQLRLYGEMANKYDIYYRVHAQKFGWLGWAKNGGSAGTAGYAYRLEGIQIRLVPKGGGAPGSTNRPFVGR